MTSLPVKQAEYISPYKSKYWEVKTKILRKQMECGRSVLDKLDVNYKSAFATSEKPSPPVEWDTQESSTPPATYTFTLKTPLKNMI